MECGCVEYVSVECGVMECARKVSGGMRSVYRAFV